MKILNKLFGEQKSEQTIIAEIHNEFDTAQDRLLSDAESILSELNIETEESMNNKAARLSALGFVNAAPVKWVKGSSLVKTREDAELIKYYKQHYPFQKFLTEKELERICKKYNLVFAPVGNYIKDVPEKNLKEIETTSNLKEQDNPKDILTCKLTKYRFLGGGSSFLSPLSKWQAILPSEIDGNYSSEYRVNEELNRIYNTGITYLVDGIENIRTSKRGLFICAPKTHFDLTGLNKTSEFSFLQFTVVEVKDPIVFRYVRGGVQVISKWGLEASDEALINEINN